MIITHLVRAYLAVAPYGTLRGYFIRRALLSGEARDRASTRLFAVAQYGSWRGYCIRRALYRFSFDGVELWESLIFAGISPDPQFAMRNPLHFPRLSAFEIADFFCSLGSAILGPPLKGLRTLESVILKLIWAFCCVRQ